MRETFTIAGEYRIGAQFAPNRKQAPEAGTARQVVEARACGRAASRRLQGRAGPLNLRAIVKL